jgi:AbrB family looped-hinge helix DNA binding protein
MQEKKCTNLNDQCWVKIYWTVTVWAKWQVVIPAQIRKTLDINVWDNLMVLTRHWKAIWMVKQDDIEELMAYMEAEMKSYKNIN